MLEQSDFKPPVPIPSPRKPPISIPFSHKPPVPIPSPRKPPVHIASPPKPDPFKFVQIFDSECINNENEIEFLKELMSSHPI